MFGRGPRGKILRRILAKLFEKFCASSADFPFRVARLGLGKAFPNLARESQVPCHDEQTLAFYADHAGTYVGSGDGGSSRHLPEFLARLRPGSCILELGCGAGWDTRAKLDAGYIVEPTDGTLAIAERAAAYLGVPVRVMRFDELEADSRYDAVWANASLLHVPRDGLPMALAKVCKALRPCGLHHATYRAGPKKDATVKAGSSTT